MKSAIKFSVAFLMVGLLLIWSCSGTKKNTTTSDDFPGTESDSLVAYLEKSPCFGRCPTFTFSVYRSGYVVYDGKTNVPNIGKYYSWLTHQQLVDMGKKAEEAGFFELNDEYRNLHLTDFPTIYIEIRYRGKKKKITHYDANPPANLVMMENYLDTLSSQVTNWNLHPVQENK